MQLILGLCNRRWRKLIATVGLRDIVVVDTKDATLITTKENAGEIKQVLAKLREEGKNEYL